MNDMALVKGLRAGLHKAAREELFLFFCLTFPTIEPQAPFVAAKHFEALATAFEKVISGDTPKLLVAVPPRFGKSMLGSVALPAWLLGRSPGSRIICASYGDQLARGFALKTRDLMLSPEYAAIFPNSKLENNGLSLDELRTTAKGYRMATSVGGVVTGKGANIIIIDDPMKAIDAESLTARHNVHEWLTGSLMSRFDPGSIGKTIVIMQRLHQDDLIGRLREEGGWAVLEMPAQLSEPATYDIGHGRAWTLGAGDLLYPAGFNEAALAERRSSMSAAQFGAQYLQRPESPEGTTFKMKLFQRYEKRPYDHHIECIVQSWDIAVSENDSANFSVCTTWAICDRRLYLLDVFRRRLEFPKLAHVVRSMKQKYQASWVIIETTGVGKPLYQDLARDPEFAHGLLHANPKAGKLERAISQLPKLERERIHLPVDAPWLASFESEVATFPIGRYDDQVDSMVQFLRALDIPNKMTIDLKAFRDGTSTF